MAHNLARELGVKVEFVKIKENTGYNFLNDGKIDIIMSGVFLTTDLIKKCAISKSYMDQTIAFIVPDYLRDKFNSADALFTSKGYSVGVTDKYYLDKLKRVLPNIEVKKLSSPRAFFKSEYKNTTALLYFAEAGSAWTLIYPSFSVAVPYPRIIKIPMVYPIPFNDTKWKQYVDVWITLRMKDGTINKTFKHWIEGEGTELKEKRWSVIKDVLHWSD
jgi:ABC-type amino acid transport substrate-binding protein